MLKRLFESNRFRRLIAPTATRIRASSSLLALTQKTKAKMNGEHSKWESDTTSIAPEYRVDFRAMLPTGFNGSIGFITPESDPIIPHFYSALEILGIDGTVHDPVHSDFHDRILNAEEKIFLCRPKHFTNQDRQLYFEKTVPIYDLPGTHLSPLRQELNIYESKRELSYFLKINKIPHPETNVFYDFKEALEFGRQCRLPQVFKTNTGSSATGVEILRDRSKLMSMINDLFLRHYIKKSLSDYRDMDYGYVILQEFIDPVREYRVIKIGESWFGHEKISNSASEFMSGSGENVWTPPPHELLDFCSEIADRLGFSTMCFDVFRSGEGPWLINELQTWFGSYNNSQMYVNMTPGRYIRYNDEWKFEAGFFNECRSLPLIIANTIRLSEHNK